MNRLPLEIDADTADRITVISLKAQREYLKADLKRFHAGEWVHPDDVDSAHCTIAALNVVITHYGGDCPITWPPA